MCLWIISACLGLLPANTVPPNVIVVGVPTPIITPTTAAPATTASPIPGNMSSPVPLPTVTNMTPSTTPPVMTSSIPPNPPSTMIVTTQPPPSTTSLMPPTNPAPPTATTNQPSTSGAIDLSVLICNSPNLVCVANPNQPTTGPMIDPRVGITQPSALPIIAYNSQDTAVKFPRTRRSLNNHDLKNINNQTKRIINIRHKRQTPTCTCVPAGTCAPYNGAGLIDFRIVTPGNGQCPQGQVYCCTGAGTTTVACGVRQTVPATAVQPAAGQASFGEYPWMAIILTNQNAYIAGGVLIDQYNVLTVIHRLTPYIVAGAAPNVKVRLGEWDAAGTYEPIPFKEYTIQKVFTHPSYNAATLQYDIAVLRLSTPVPFTPAAGSVASINRACLPPTPTSVYTGQRCWVTGWGQNAFNQGQYQQILKEVDLPIVDPNTCQNLLRTARLGAAYVLDTTSFICAGGEVNKDACTGDGGSGLVCQVNGQWMVTGIVAWGLGCANANVPGVYLNVATLLPWIQQQVASN